MLLMQRRFWMPLAYSSSFVVIMPPSPQVVMFLSEWNENAPQSPIEPAARPLYFEPVACAQSSSTLRPCFFAISMIGSMSTIWPA